MLRLKPCHVLDIHLMAILCTDLFIYLFVFPSLVAVNNASHGTVSSCLRLGRDLVVHLSSWSGNFGGQFTGNLIPCNACV